MQLHEYQAKEILKNNNVPIPEGQIASTCDDSKKISLSLGGKCVVKAQVHAGGRGKAGGIKLANNEDEAFDFADQMLGSSLKTFQSGETEFPINQVYIEKASDINSEYYLAVTMDFDLKCPVIIFSTEGGMNIEEVAEKNPDKIIKIHVDPLVGPSPYKIRDLSNKFNLEKEISSQLYSIILKLYEIFISFDCTLIEINPLALVSENKLVALDAKITIDDDSLFRHKDLQGLFDETQVNKSELIAQKNDLAYIKLSDGEVGCMVNGAGLAMATMDITMKAGALPSNFLDVGGSASEERIKEAYNIITSDNDVKIILVNLFGGILRCDIAAKGIIEGFKENQKTVPMVVVLRGTNSEEAKEILKDSGMEIYFSDDLPSAANEINKRLGR
ncbi:MAG: ADP-forming succinate--CoA ligase subunit beta [Chloroflexi bacterium]|nr:ADP-forming succinate--CoA ligase subunit beta [Chloroflexota bacterium]